MIDVMIALLGLCVAGGLLYLITLARSQFLKLLCIVSAIVAFLLSLLLTSVTYVGSDQVGIVRRNALGPSLPPGQIIATKGEMGVQANVLAPGWHFGYWPIIYDIQTVPVIKVPDGQLGLVKAIDGRPLRSGQVFADEIPENQFRSLLEDPVAFLGSGSGQKGLQTNVLTPGQYRLNTALFEVRMVPLIDVKAGSVGVIKSNVGSEPSVELPTPQADGDIRFLAKEGERGTRLVPLRTGQYSLNPEAFQVLPVSTGRRVANYTSRDEGPERTSDSHTLGPIPVKSQDGFTFPVDVRVIYFIKEADAPRVVALFGGDNDLLQEVLTSRVRSIFRDNAESVSALDYINQRSIQAANATKLLSHAMTPYGITVESIDIGNVGGDNPELNALLETQRNRKIAAEEQDTYIAQQKAAEQKKELTRTEQEVEEEKRLATATYAVQIAEQEQQKRLIAANAEAEALRIEAEARAEAFRLIAAELGQANAALVEVLKLVGEGNIQITPRVMVNAAPGPATTTPQSPETIALIGTMLDSMLDRSERDSTTRLPTSAQPTSTQPSKEPTP